MDDKIRLAADQLKEHQFDLVITNTIVLLIGAELALRLNVPHVVFVLELINSDGSLKPIGLSVDSYIQYLDSRTAGWLACSNSVKSMIVGSGKINPEKVFVFYPKTSGKNNIKNESPFLSPDFSKNQKWKIILIGEQSNRKKPNFWLARSKASASNRLCCLS